MPVLHADLATEGVLNGHDRELGEIHASLEHLKYGIVRLESALQEHNVAFNKRLDDHEEEEREHRKLIWNKIGNISNMILWAGGGVAGAYFAIKVIFKL